MYYLALSTPKSFNVTALGLIAPQIREALFRELWLDRSTLNYFWIWFWKNLGVVSQNCA